jgi:hypothetical protein
VPAPPETGPGGEWTAAADEQDRARFRALQKVWRIADRLRQLTETRLFRLACRVDTSTPAPLGAGPLPFKFGPDYRFCLWGSREFPFTAMQAAVVEALLRARENGTPDVSQIYLLEQAGSDMNDSKPQLSKLFQDHDAWGTLIVPGATKGTYRLADPQS